MLFLIPTVRCLLDIDDYPCKAYKLPTTESLCCEKSCSCAGISGVRLGPSLNIPNGSLGSFGAVTPAETPYQDRTQLFDVAAAGPVPGFLVAVGLFAYGLSVRSMQFNLPFYYLKCSFHS
jgi:hypothetical protein